MINLDSRKLRLVLLGAVLLFILAAALVFSNVAPPYYDRRHDLTAYGQPGLDYRLAEFSALNGWRKDNHSEALGAFVRSCEKLTGLAPEDPANPQEYLGEEMAGITLSGAVKDWRDACFEAARIAARADAPPETQRDAARIFFETWFQPLEVIDKRVPLADGPARRQGPLSTTEGLFTGYYEPVLPASPIPTEEFSAPVYSRPDDLIDVDLGAFRAELAGQRIAGRLDGKRLAPYPDRRAINDGALAGKTEPLAWMRPTDLFFLQIQGSGRLGFPDGGALRVGYAGQNGHAYTPIGRTMVERDIMPLKDVSMQSIREWLENADAASAREMRENNASYVFFSTLDDIDPALGPLGAQGAPLTPMRSLAVDRRFHAMGAPIWLDVDAQLGADIPAMRRLMIAQDTGGAIKGPVRGDIYWGTGDEAGEIAGKMNARGRMYVFVPRAIAARLLERERS